MTTPPDHCGLGSTTSMRFLTLSRQGAGRWADRTDEERLYLEVPYADRHEAKKQLGARWDPGRRKWYVDAAKVSREQAARWLPPTP
ncbi:DUF5710 domain-containing protein [Streptomyces sp. NPDC005423]|uniref:DUF5710 domain-containing protein n=1 Tax=Streptomyces sp. NPDC005423 TaxID=3155343 RepID=UPI0033B5FBB5